MRDLLVAEIDQVAAGQAVHVAMTLGGTAIILVAMILAYLERRDLRQQ